MKIEQLLAHVGEPVEDGNAVVVAELGGVLYEVYQESYEEMCIADHNQAESTTIEVKAQARALAEVAHQRAWRLYQDPEFCALVSDDVRTLSSLHLQTDGKLTAFQSQRLAWYERGRFPCGYHGIFPNGKWVVH